MEEQQRKSVLVVDDDIGLVKFIAQVLRINGYVPVSAYSGEATLDAYSAAPPHLILLDIAMPGLNGWDVAERIRVKEDPTGTHTPIVIMSAQSRIFEVSQQFRQRVDAFLTKPFGTEEIVAQVAAMIGPGIQ